MAQTNRPIVLDDILSSLDLDRELTDQGHAGRYVAALSGKDIDGASQRVNLTSHLHGISSPVRRRRLLSSAEIAAFFPQAELAAEIERPWWEATMNSMPQMAWTSTAEGNLDYYNLRWHEYTGMTFEQTRRDGWKSLLHPDDLGTCVQRWAQSISTGEPYEIEYRFKRASDDTYRWHLDRAAPLRDSERRIVRWFGTCTDVHAQKAVQEELDAQVRSRTLQLEEKIRQLQIAEQRISESLTEKELLLQEIQHRVKNNLQIILSLLQMQSECVADQATRDLFQESRNRVLSMALVHEHLLHAQDIAQVDFGTYITKLVKGIAAAHPCSRDVAFRIEVVTGVMLHANQNVPCGLILTELVSNCLKHGLAAGGGWLEVRVSQADDLVTIRVQDSGPGLPRQFSVSGQKSLGLKIVSALTRQLRGRLTCGSADGAWFEIQFSSLGAGIGLLARA